MNRLIAKSTPLIALDAAAVDTETTGLDSRNARILQIGAIRLRGQQILAGEKFNRLVNPGIPIPARSTVIHGIEDGDVLTAAGFAEVYNGFRSFIGSAVVIGHNIDFDYGVMAQECARAGLVWSAPLALDVRILARLAAPQLASHSLDALSDWLGLKNSRRHDALADAIAAAEIFIMLLPRLRDAGIRTLGEAETASAQHAESLAMSKYGTLPAASNLPKSASDDAERVIMRLDSYPYRHRVGDVMTSPAAYAPADASIEEAAKFMLDNWVSAALVTDGGRTGIVTERDLLRAMAARASGGPDPQLRDIMSWPVHTVGEHDFIYRALGRIDRLGIRHLPVTDETGAIAGMVTPRNLLRQRTTAAFMLGDEIETAEDVAALGKARAKLAVMAQALVDEEVDPRDIAAVISSEICAFTARAAVIAEERLEAAGHGKAPVAYAVLVMGSGGRGESLLAADQDNAIIFEHGEAGGPEDRWLEALGTEIAAILDDIGIPFCKGGIMAKNALWRHSLQGWREVVDGWVRRSRPQDLLNVDIFFDVVAVCGARGLAQEIRHYAYERGKASPPFLKLLAEVAGEQVSPFTFFGGLKTDEKGRIDLKRAGLMPLFTSARILAIKFGIEARTTPQRLAALKGKGIGAADEFDAAIDAHRIILGQILSQQLADTRAGIPLSNHVDLSRLSKTGKDQLKVALHAVEPMMSLIREARL